MHPYVLCRDEFKLTVFPRYPAIVYTKDGEAIKERLWNETMEELKFAGVSKVLEEL